MAHLTFTIDNYDEIPSVGAVFIHGLRFAWHNDEPYYDNAVLLITLDISAALAQNGYHNLRCDWSTSTCSKSESPPQGSLKTSIRAIEEPWNTRVVSDSYLSRTLATLFGYDEDDIDDDFQIDTSTSVRKDLTLHLGRNDAIRSQCCGQLLSRVNAFGHILVMSMLL